LFESFHVAELFVNANYVGEQLSHLETRLSWLTATDDSKKDGSFLLIEKI